MVSDSGVDDKEVLGASPRRPILVTEENGVGTPLNATGQETVKPLKAQYGADVPGWRWEERRNFTEVGWWKLTMYRGRRIVADNLAALGQRYGKDGRVLMVPPGTVASIVAVEQRRWMEERLRDAEDSTAKDDGP
ncbi:hypothetical protein V6N13_081213 [Hibiscus sabdariffa]